MQIFIPYQSPLECAKALWSDKLRYNKQLIEAKQILDAIDGAKAWRNHPVCLMYKPHRAWLACYMECLNNFSKYKKGLGQSVFGENEYYLLSIQYNIEADKIRPQFITDELCDQHKRRLFSKSPELYNQFASYGTSEENWYVIDGQIVKYVNGKRIN